MFIFLFFLYIFLVFPLSFAAVSLFFLVGKASLSEWSQRLGFYWFFKKNTDENTAFLRKTTQPQNISAKGVIWVHLSSLGEWKTAELFLERCSSLAKKKIFLTYFNPDLKKYFQKNNPPHFIANHSFFPIENPLTVALFVKKYHILAFCLVEMELWPITILSVKALDVPIFWVNVTLFEKEKRNYRFFSFLFRPIFQAFQGIYASSKLSQERLLTFLPSEKKVEVLGNFKIDRALAYFSQNRKSPEWVKIVKFLAKKRKIVIFTSFHSAEKKAVKACLAEKKSDYFIIFVPRYVDASNIESWRKLFAQYKKKMILRSDLRGKLSSLENSEKKADVFLLDSYGEMQFLFPIVDLTVVGGSFICHGGQDILEPLGHGVSVITGPHMFHFAQMMEIFSDFVVQVSSNVFLSQHIHQMLMVENKNTQKKRSVAVRKIMLELANASDNTSKALVKKLRDLKKI